MVMADLPLLHGWLQDAEVARWFDESSQSLEEVAAKYGPCIRGEEPTEMWMAVIDGADAGWLQTYAVAAYPEYAEACATVGFDRDGAALDYLLADQAQRNQGVGSAMLRAFTDEVVFGRHPGWTAACSSPDPANIRSWRALEKAGFRVLGDITTEDGPERVLAKDRPRG